MAKPTIVISYDYDYDKHYENLLVAWDEKRPSQRRCVVGDVGHIRRDQEAIGGA